jgi:hypothetical protein
MRRVFGDLASAPGSTRVEVTERLGLEPRHQFAPMRAQNTVDIRLTIEATDLLHAGQAEAFCLIKSDADFVPLISRIWEHGLPDQPPVRHHNRRRPVPPRVIAFHLSRELACEHASKRPNAPPEG